VQSAYIIGTRLDFYTSEYTDDVLRVYEMMFFLLEESSLLVLKLLEKFNFRPRTYF
jgi:hypothetical protein